MLIFSEEGTGAGAPRLPSTHLFSVFVKEGEELIKLGLNRV